MKKFYLILFAQLALVGLSQESDLQLHDLYEPEPVKFSFEAPGWTMLAIFILFIITVFSFLRLRRFIKNRYRRAALRELESVSGSVSRIFVVLKNTAKIAFNHDQTSDLYGLEWLGFLEQSGRNVEMIKFSDQIFSVLYQGKEIDNESFESILLNAKKWVKTHAR